MSSSSYAHSRWEDQQPRRFSVPLPATGSLRTGLFGPKLKCWNTLCVVAVGDAIYLYSLPDFVLQRTIRHPSGDKISDFDLQNSLLAVVSRDGTLVIWDISEGVCWSTIRTMSYAEVEQGFVCSSIRITVPGLGQVTVSNNCPSAEGNGVVPGEDKPMFVSWIYYRLSGRRSKAKCRVWRLPNLGVEEQGPPINNDTIKANPSLLVREIHAGLRMSCFDTFGGMTAAGFPDLTIRVWDIISGRCKWVLLGHLEQVTKLLLNSSKVCSASEDKTIRVWDMETGECLHILQFSSSSSFLDLCLTSTYLASLTYEALEIWDIYSGQQTAYIHPPKPLVFSSNLHVDDQKAVVGYEVIHDDNEIAGFRLWNTQSGGFLGDCTLTVDKWTRALSLYSGPRFGIALVKRKTRAYHLEVLDFGVDSDIHSDNSGRPSRQDEGDPWPLEQNTRWHRMSVAGCGILYYVLVASVLYFSI